MKSKKEGKAGKPGPLPSKEQMLYDDDTMQLVVMAKDGEQVEVADVAHDDIVGYEIALRWNSHAALVEAAKAMLVEVDLWRKRKAEGFSFDPDGADDMLRAALALAEKP